MLASTLIEQLKAAVEEHGDYEVLDEAESTVEDIEFNSDNEDDEDPVFILTT